MPRGVKKEVEVNQSYNLPDVNVPVSGAVSRDDVKIQEVETYSNMVDFNDKAAQLAFNEEPVTIHLHESTDPNAEPMVYCAVNGEGAQPGNPYLIRGRTYTLKRKFVGVLANARTVTYSQPYRDEGSERANMMRPHAAQRYPFSVIEDKNPKGVAWLKQLMGG